MNLTVLRSSRLAILIAVAAGFSACRTPNRSTLVAGTQTPPPAPLYEWNGDEVQGKLRIRISLSDQKAQLFKGDQNVGWTRVATGLPSHPTPKGSFSIMEKKRDKYSSKYGVIVDGDGNVIDRDAAVGRESVKSGCHFVAAPMPYWMRLTGYGVGMHAGSIPNPGYPASHGCIRLPTFMAEKLFEQTQVGTPVTITN